MVCFPPRLTDVTFCGHSPEYRPYLLADSTLQILELGEPGQGSRLHPRKSTWLSSLPVNMTELGERAQPLRWTEVCWTTRNKLLYLFDFQRLGSGFLRGQRPSRRGQVRCEAGGARGGVSSPEWKITHVKLKYCHISLSESRAYFNQTTVNQTKMV